MQMSREELRLLRHHIRRRQREVLYLQVELEEMEIDMDVMEVRAWVVGCCCSCLWRGVAAHGVVAVVLVRWSTVWTSLMRAACINVVITVAAFALLHATLLSSELRFKPLAERSGCWYTFVCVIRSLTWCLQ
jgi:hypothetical protein